MICPRPNALGIMCLNCTCKVPHAEKHICKGTEGCDVPCIPYVAPESTDKQTQSPDEARIALLERQVGVEGCVGRDEFGRGIAACPDSWIGKRVRVSLVE